MRSIFCGIFVENQIPPSQHIVDSGYDCAKLIMDSLRSMISIYLVQSESIQAGKLIRQALSIPANFRLIGR